MHEKGDATLTKADILVDAETPDEREEAKRRLNIMYLQLAKKGYTDVAKAIHELPEDADFDTVVVLFNDAISCLKDIDRLNTQPPQIKAEPLLDKFAIDDFKRQWLVPQWLPTNTVTLFTGKGGIGKSFMTLQHLAALTLGKAKCYLKQQAFDDAPNLAIGAVNVVFASWEDEIQEVSQRLRRISETLEWPDYTEIEKKFHYVDMSAQGPVWGVETGIHLGNRGVQLGPGYALRKICEDAKARLLVIDPLAGGFGANENDRSATREFVANWSAWCKDKNCALLLIAHPPKSNADYSGSTDWEGSCRSMWTLKVEGITLPKEGKGKPQTQEFFALSNPKRNYATKAPEIALERDGPVWIEATREAAISFYERYAQTTVNSDPYEDGDSTNEDASLAGPRNEADRLNFN